MTDRREPLAAARWVRTVRGLLGLGRYKRRMYLYSVVCDVLPERFWTRSATLRRFAGKP